MRKIQSESSIRFQSRDRRLNPGHRRVRRRHVAFCVQGVISPVLCNLFMHYAFDLWMGRTFAHAPWCRYADDGLVHCRTKEEALRIMTALAERLAECGLEMHPEKTRIVYCKDSNRRGQYPNTKFDFLGYTFRPRVAMNHRQNQLFVSFSPAVSSKALTAMRQRVREWNIRNRTDLSLTEIARLCNPVLRGWLQYYGRFCPSAMKPVLEHFNQRLVAWAMKKFKRLRESHTRAWRFLAAVGKRQPHLFAHWPGMAGVFV